MKFASQICDKNVKKDFRGRGGTNGNSIQAKKIWDVKGEHSNNTRRLRRIAYRRNRNSYRPCNSPLIKETVVMLQDDPRSPYGKHFYKAQTPVDKPNFQRSTEKEPSLKPETIVAEDSSICKSYSHESTPHKQKDKPKTSNTTSSLAREHKLPQPTKYHANKEETMEMAIVAEGSSISKSQVNLIETHLLNRIDVIPEGGPSPGFTHFKYKSGHVMVCSSNKTSRVWLVKEINDCVLWDDIKLKVIEAKKLANPIKTMVWIPGSYIQPQKLLRRLRIQNAGLDTTPWQVVGENADKESYTYFINVDERSWQKIMNLGRRLHLNFTRVTFKATNESPLDIPEASKNEEATVACDAFSRATTQQETEIAAVESVDIVESFKMIATAENGTKVDINFQEEKFFISAGELMVVDNADDQIGKVDEPISLLE